MKKTIMFFVMLGVIFLSGCATQEIKLVESQKYIMVNIDPKYLNDCEVAPPPDKKTYPTLSHDAKEDLLIQTLITQYQYTGNCTIDKKNLRELIEKQKNEIDQFNLKEEERLKTLGVKRDGKS